MNNTLQIFQTEPDELTLSIVADDHDFLSVPLFADEIENLILNLTLKLACLRGYTPDMFDAPTAPSNQWYQKGIANHE